MWQVKEKGSIVKIICSGLLSLLCVTIVHYLEGVKNVHR